MQQLSVLLYLADIDKPLHDYMLWKANVYSHSDRLLQILVSAIRYMSKHRYPHILLVVQYTVPRVLCIPKYNTDVKQVPLIYYANDIARPSSTAPTRVVRQVTKTQLTERRLTF